MESALHLHLLQLKLWIFRFAAHRRNRLWRHSTLRWGIVLFNLGKKICGTKPFYLSLRILTKPMNATGRLLKHVIVEQWIVKSLHLVFCRPVTIQTNHFSSGILVPVPISVHELYVIQNLHVMVKATADIPDIVFTYSTQTRKDNRNLWLPAFYIRTALS